jgi:hypothetical protein
MNMQARLQSLRAGLDRLEPELLAWQQHPTAVTRYKAHGDAQAMARELQAILNALKPSRQISGRGGIRKALAEGREQD